MSNGHASRDIIFTLVPSSASQLKKTGNTEMAQINADRKLKKETFFFKITSANPASVIYITK
jgi:hypothetical protein